MFSANQLKEQLFRWRYYFLLSLGFLAIGLGLDQLHQAMNTQVEIIIPTPTPFSLTVAISGAVRHPGVYHFDRPARLQDLLVASGGLSQNADRAWVARSLNLAAPLQDGQKIYIPRPGEAVAGQQTFTISLNQASQQDLTNLPGVGPHLAQAIITYRQKHRGFRTLSELQAVPGIGPKLFQKLRPFLRL